MTAMTSNLAKALRGATIAGLGFYVPERVLTNADLEAMVDTSDEWIVTRTGIRERRIAAAEQATSDLAIRAAIDALESARLTPADLNLILVATCTGDFNSFPATATIVQDKLGAKCPAFDIAAVCSGFAYALDVAVQYVQNGRYDNVLVIGAETMSRTVNWHDRATCILFGDGAGAAVVRPCVPGVGIIGGMMGADGSGACLQNMPAGGSRLPLTPEMIANNDHLMIMKGAEVYRFAVEVMGEAAIEAIESVGLTPADVDWLVPHQANIRIITAAAKRMDLPMEKVVVNIETYGNTSAASIPIALAEAGRRGQFKVGDIVVTVGFGAGLTWAANVIRWTMEGPK